MKLPLKLNNENDIYYNCKKPYSYGSNFIGVDGGRGIGKTTTFGIDCFKQVEKGNQFVWLRRYKPEIRELIHKDSFSNIIDGLVYKGDGNGGAQIMYENTLCGYLIPLIKYRDYKSVNFDKVTRIIFDEAFVMETIAYRYLQDEIKIFWEMVSTIVRTRKNYKIILLANNEDTFNPYYRFFKVPIFKGVYIDKDRGLYFEHAEPSAKLVEKEKETPLYDMIKGTSYADYHYGNKNINEDKSIKIIQKPKDCKLMFRLEINDKTINCYLFNNENTTSLFIEYRDKIIDDNITYHLCKDNKPNYYYVDLYKKKLKHFIQRLYYTDNNIYCDNENSGLLFNWVLTNIK